MSEVQSRPAASRGRGSGRGGRGGGFATRGGSRTVTRNSATNGDTKHDTDSSLPTLEDEGEIGQLKQKYGSKVAVIKEMFQDWSDVDILFALRETDGDENLTVTRMAEGTISQWGEVSKPKKERTRSKAKNDTFATSTADSAPTGGPRAARGGRGVDSGRGRGRATERGGRGGARGKSTPATTNGTRDKETQPLSIPTEESSEWNNTKPAEEPAGWGEPTTTENATPAATTAPSTTTSASKPATIPEGTKTTWASMLRQSTAPKPAPKQKETPAQAPEPTIEPLPSVEPLEPELEPEVSVTAEETAAEPAKEPVPAPPTEPIVPAVPTIPVPSVAVPEVTLLPSKDQLTETNLDKIADDSHPPPTGTAASEAADSWDPRGTAASATATPLSASQQQHQANRTPASGFATTATKATSRPPTFPRRMLDQLEPVRMPGNRDQVDRAAVQFGAFSLNGPIDDDVDGDREEPETRPQPPEDSPVAHPRTSLPPVQPTPVPEVFPAQKPAASQIPTGPAATTPSTAQANPAATAQASAQPPAAPSNQQFGRFSQPASQEASSFPTTKPFEPFGQQQPGASTAQNQFEGGGFQSQGQAGQPQTQQQPGGPFSSAPTEFSSYYTADPQNRFNNYYNQNFGQQQGAQGQQETLSSQPQRSFAGYNAPQNENLSQYPQSGAQHGPSRFSSGSGADAQISGTPTPAQAVSQAQTGPSGQAQSHGQQQPHDYPYSHPYYQNPYYSAYVNYQGGYSQGGYGGPYGKGGLGYQPNQYGISPQGPHGYSSPGAFGQSALHRDSGGLGDYARAGSAQSAAAQQGLGSGFGGVHDTFGRGGSAYQSQAAPSFNAPGSQPGSGPAAADDLKPFGDAKAAGGPSPSLAAAARPGSAANNGPSQTGLPPPQSNQQSGLGGMGGYGYPAHMQGLHGSQSSAGGYGMSAGGGQSHQSGYGGYGAQGFAGSYYANQAPRGWGNNYH
ncbi:RNAPII degradation factor [Madurella fahalii]|uniref:RNA polymerase II degradation factor 1 n=1 Tax=Madurella fahalii TaxID=1157608 RepID=A0ABQ0GN47_9PEZI